MTTQPTPAGELIVCGWERVFLLELSTGETAWNWRADDQPSIPAGRREQFKTTDECKPVGSDRILITSSTNGVALVRRQAGEPVFQTTVPNAHSAEMLPGERLAVASSHAEGGDRLVVFDLDRPGEPVCEDRLSWAHGAVWDAERGLLWALGADELRAYRLCGWETDSPSLSRAEALQLPSGGGHDLSAVPHSPLLIVTVQEGVYQFHRDRRTFTPDPRLGNERGVKCVAVHPDTGRIAYVQAEGGHWWAERIRLLDPDGVLHVPGEHFYKVRWAPTGPRSDSAGAG